MPSMFDNFDWWTAGKYGPEKTSYLDTFHALRCTSNVSSNKHIILLNITDAKIQTEEQSKSTQSNWFIQFFKALSSFRSYS